MCLNKEGGWEEREGDRERRRERSQRKKSWVDYYWRKVIILFIYVNLSLIIFLKIQYLICYASTKYVFIIRMGKINGYVKIPFQNKEGELKSVVIINSSY